MTRYFTARAAYASAILAVLPLSHVAMGATVEPNYEAAQRVVNFADLDVTRDAGAAVLYTRIVAAARWVCDPPIPLYGELRAHAARCFEHAVDQAVTDVGVPALTTYHLAKVKPPGVHN
jgi:UrcA family protein